MAETNNKHEDFHSILKEHTTCFISDVVITVALFHIFLHYMMGMSWPTPLLRFSYLFVRNFVKSLPTRPPLHTYWMVPNTVSWHFSSELNKKILNCNKYQIPMYLIIMSLSILLYKIVRHNINSNNKQERKLDQWYWDLNLLKVSKNLLTHLTLQ